MPEERDEQEPVGAETTDETQTENTDIDAKLQKALDEVNRKWQSKFDKLLQEKRETEQQAEKGKQTLEERLAAIEAERLQERQELSRERMRGLAAQMLSEAGVKTKLLAKLIGETEDETREYVQAYIEERQEAQAEANRERAKRNGRAPMTGDGEPLGILSRDELRAKFKADPEWGDKNPELFQRSMENLTE